MKLHYRAGRVEVLAGSGNFCLGLAQTTFEKSLSIHSQSFDNYIPPNEK
jgi:hypothetical protein